MSTSTGSIRRRLETLLTEDGIESGERIPTERELAQRLHVSRATIRRVLGELEAQGLIVRHVGRGTFLIAAPAPDNGRTSPRDVMVVRRLRRTGCAATCRERDEPAAAVTGVVNGVRAVADDRRC